ncbi:hypothetical protein GCG54_00008419 [Colletotrichum gloeosporioides]|uniref:Mid2 domain-containing protein n=1 Tax=Colletotrichum gloeosporioides TaxID=474922 RepID=A0A8H4FJA2_COLGL|nr:uncharacterized protein GCG54_00008419 [Colletotrichum gloeosporioides]KAF3803916.1 hypothetical protein GCG54_00008419 [Colletotrichum gloeosporioides]
MSYLIGLLFSLIFVSFAITEDVFRRPPGPGPTNDYSDNPIYTLGEKVRFVWESDPLNDIWIWNNKADSTTGDRSSARILQNYSSLDYTWEVSYDGFPDDADLSLPVFYLALYSSGSGAITATSHYFNITEASTTTAAASSPTSSSQSQASATSSSPAATGTSSQQTSQSLGTGAVAGIAVGATLGTIAVVSVIGWFVWRALRKKKLGQPDKGGEPVDGPADHPSSMEVMMSTSFTLDVSEKKE